MCPQDGKVRLYSVQGNTLKDDGKVLEVQGPVTDMSYSQDGAFLAVTDEKKVVTVFTVADGYAVNSLHSQIFMNVFDCDSSVMNESSGDSEQTNRLVQQFLTACSGSSDGMSFVFKAFLSLYKLGMSRELKQVTKIVIIEIKIITFFS